jgi:hypothetical protein
MTIKSNKAVLKAVSQLRPVLMDLTLTTDERVTFIKAFNDLMNQLSISKGK